MSSMLWFVLLFIPDASSVFCRQCRAITSFIFDNKSRLNRFLVHAKADKVVLLRFGVPAVLAAFAGAWLLLQITDLQPLFSYNIGSKTIDVFTVKFIVSVLLLVFAIIELLPYFKHFQFNKNKPPIGGILSGFFGGRSGNQGAFRSAFLMKAGLLKETFIGTAVVVSTFLILQGCRFMQVDSVKCGLKKILY